MKTLTYGNLPTYDDFATAFESDLDLGPNTLYHIRNDPYFGSDDLTCTEIYEQLERARDDWEKNGSEPAGDFASAVLTTLGFEWV